MTAREQVTKRFRNLMTGFDNPLEAKKNRSGIMDSQYHERTSKNKNRNRSTEENSSASWKLE
jgi:hypothetical protein